MRSYWKKGKLSEKDKEIIQEKMEAAELNQSSPQSQGGGLVLRPPAYKAQKGFNPLCSKVSCTAATLEDLVVFKWANATQCSDSALVLLLAQERAHRRTWDPHYFRKCSGIRGQSVLSLCH